MSRKRESLLNAKPVVSGRLYKFDPLRRNAMEDTSRPASPQENLWDSILNSVSSRRSVPSGNVLILGEPSTGKTTLVNALLQKSSTSTRGETGDKVPKLDFALGYQWANVKEEGDEGELALLDWYGRQC